MPTTGHVASTFRLPPVVSVRFMGTETSVGYTTGSVGSTVGSGAGPGARPISRRAALAGGAAGIGALLAATVVPKARAARTGGIEATDLEVVTVTPTSVTFGFASYTAPHPAYGPLRPTVPTLGEVALAPADDPIVAADPVGSEAIAGPAGSWIRPGMPDLPVVASSDSETGFHLITVDGLEPGREYVFECRCDGVPATPGLMTTNKPDSPEVSGRITTLTPPPGEHVATIAVLNDTHIGEEKHGLILGDFPEAIVQEPGLPPFPEVMLAAALAEIRDRGVGRVFVNGDTTSEARPHEMWRTDVGGLRVIGLDSSMLDESGGRIKDDQFAALESELAADAATNVDFVEFGSAAGYPGGYTLIHLHTGGYRVNFHRTGSPEALHWSSRSRWAMYGLNPEYTLGSTAHRNYVVERDLSGLAP